METNASPGDYLTIDSNQLTIEQYPYPKGWKALALTVGQKPKGFYQWFNFLWGWDMFFWKIPFGKTLVAINILIWIIIV